MAPHFLNLFPAAIAAAAVIPALLLLYFLKLRRRPMPVASTLLWKKAIQDLQVNAPFQKLRRNLLLLLQMLLLLALLLALSRPVVNDTQAAGARSIILIDCSASMSATDGIKRGTRLDEAKTRARQLVESMPNGAAAMVISFNDSAQIVQPFVSDQRVLYNAIDSIQATDRPTRLEAAYRLADAQAAFTAAHALTAAGHREAPDVYLFSDGRVADAAHVSVEGNLHYEQVGTSTAHNVAIVAMNARRNYEEPTQVQVFARLANFGPDPVSDVQVQLSVDGVPRSVALVNLLPDRWDDQRRKAAIDAGFVPKEGIEFPPLDLTSSAVIKVEQLSTTPDALRADDSAVVVVPPPKIMAVLLVSNGDFFLDEGLRSQRLKVYDTMSVGDYRRLPSAAGGGKKLPKPYDVIVFDRDDSLVAADVPRTGAAVYFGCVPPGLELKAAVDPATKQPVMDDDNTVLDWKRDHPILRHLNISKLYAAHCFHLLPTLNSDVLVDGNNGPLMVLHRENRAFHLVVPFDIIQSNMPLHPWFPAMLHQMLQFLALGTDMNIKPSYPPGVALRIPNLQGLDPSKPVQIFGPMGTLSVKIPPTGDFVLPELDKVGLYSTNPPIPQYEKIAVSLLDPIESNLLPAPLAPGGEGTHVQAVTGGQSRRELWWWFVAVGALPLLLIEWWVYTRRVHL